jgi:hypothetical protein
MSHEPPFGAARCRCGTGPPLSFWRGFAAGGWRAAPCRPFAADFSGFGSVPQASRTLRPPPAEASGCIGPGRRMRSKRSRGWSRRPRLLCAVRVLHRALLRLPLRLSGCGVAGSGAAPPSRRSRAACIRCRPRTRRGGGGGGGGGGVGGGGGPGAPRAA